MEIEKLKKLACNVAWLAVADFYEENGNNLLAKEWREKAVLMEYYLSILKKMKEGYKFPDHYTGYYNIPEQFKFNFHKFKLYSRAKYTRKKTKNYTYYHQSNEPKVLDWVEITCRYSTEYIVPILGTKETCTQTSSYWHNFSKIYNREVKRETTHVKKVLNMYNFLIATELNFKIVD